MNISRALNLATTCLARAAHRHGFGVQSPWAYELVRDVLFEPLHYYAYEEQGLRTKWQRQLWRIRNHYPNVVVIRDKGSAAKLRYEKLMAAGTCREIVIERISSENAALWNTIVNDKRATITFDMRSRGLIVIDPKRIKQNYLL